MWKRAREICRGGPAREKEMEKEVSDDVWQCINVMSCEGCGQC